MTWSTATSTAAIGLVLRCSEAASDGAVAPPAPVPGAVVTVTWKGNLVARKRSDASGHFTFSGWIGRRARVPHVVTLHREGGGFGWSSESNDQVMVQLLPQTNVQFKICVAST